MHGIVILTSIMVVKSGRSGIDVCPYILVHVFVVWFQLYQQLVMTLMLRNFQFVPDDIGKIDW